MSNASYQAVLLIAFGGPTCPEEIRPFLARVLKGVAVPPERVEEVVRHYEAVGGKSPLNEITLRQANALQKALYDKQLALRVYTGIRNSSPFFIETLKKMADDGITNALGFILSSHKTEASWERYQKNIADALAELGGIALNIDYCNEWYDHPLFIQTWVELIRSSMDAIAKEKRHATPLLFTAHSLPVAMAAKSPYVEQVETSARMIVEKLGHGPWSIAYQSRSGEPMDPWLEPDVGQVIRDLRTKKISDLVVAPIGFVCDHVEVLYDLDIEVKSIASGVGIGYRRAACPNDHPVFIRMITEIIEAAVLRKSSMGS